MTVEQLLKDIQRLLDRGTISPSAEINIEGEVAICNDDFDYVGYFETHNLKIDINKSHYNKLLLISEPDDV